ncbi:MAG: deoxyribose-phosphate aldolase [Eubacteriales bacterium]|nr:deoxyribose-phosphate aldolase [Eubacteriales bacterium]MDD3882474.1 deoxyribose-phosphate aldolase [Eubacteriales bacterium]MDD4513196.1 deoxyribose-phosphate aldolase [Eubacteriales bacterium]
MKASEIASKLDHSTLQPFLIKKDIIEGCEIAKKWHCATVCSRPEDMKLVSQLLKGSGVKPCTVIGFPHGTNLPEVKLFETEKAIEDGCEELDMVINFGKLLEGDLDYVRNEIKLLADACHSKGAILKVIIETCYLDDEQKKTACRLSEEAGADFVKTSTGYGKSGCNAADLRLMRETVGNRLSVKGSGGIRTLDAALEYIAAGADRLGVSATEAIMEEAVKRENAGIL